MVLVVDIAVAAAVVEEECSDSAQKEVEGGCFVVEDPS
jgi:hypothetical protein